jgi:hypothetical protein
MSKYEITKVDGGEDELPVLAPKLENSISKVFDTLIDVNEKDIIVRENCKLCKHSLRYEAERKWEELDFNYTKTNEWLNEQITDLNAHLEEDERERYFNTMNVRNHMKGHYKEQERQIRLREYASKIEDLVNLKQDKSRMLETSLAICYENLSKVASAETDGGIKSEKDRSAAINQVVSTMLSVIDMQAKMEGEIKSAEMVQEKFVGLWVDIINKEQSDVKKKVLVSMLEDFAGNFSKV